MYMRVLGCARSVAQQPREDVVEDVDKIEAVDMDVASPMLTWKKAGPGGPVSHQRLTQTLQTPDSA